VDLEDGQSQSPIMMALEAGNVDIARVLLRYKADVNSFNLRGENAIWLCIVRSIPDLLAEFVASGASDLGAPLERHRNTLLHKLILFIENEQMGCMMVASLLSHGAKVDSLNDEKKTPLFHACALSKFKIVTLLLNSGANPKHADCFENTPLHFAFVPNVAAALVDKGAKVNAANQHGMTPMHVMSAFGMSETVSMLRAMGGRDNERNKNGNTPADVFNLVPPRDWHICLPFFAEDEASVATGGIVIHDKPRTEGGAQTASVKTLARNSFRNVGRKLKEAGKKIRDELEQGTSTYNNNNTDDDE
jgi:ankyrin repeat protein